MTARRVRTALRAPLREAGFAEEGTQFVHRTAELQHRIEVAGVRRMAGFVQLHHHIALADEPNAWLTEELASAYEFPAEVKATHLMVAKAGGLLALPVIATGLWLWRDPRARVWHRVAVLLWLAIVLTATGTGLWMFSQGTLRAG